MSLAYPGSRLRIAGGRFVRYGDNENLAGTALLEMYDGDNRLVLDHGASGSPVLDCEGRVVAIVSNIFTQTLQFPFLRADLDSLGKSQRRFRAQSGLGGFVAVRRHVESSLARADSARRKAARDKTCRRARASGKQASPSPRDSIFGASPEAQDALPDISLPIGGYPSAILQIPDCTVTKSRCWLLGSEKIGRSRHDGWRSRWLGGRRSYPLRLTTLDLWHPLGNGEYHPRIGQKWRKAR